MIATEFATVLGDREGPLVSTAEHVLAALRGMGVDNAIIEIDGPEVPIMDGSAAAFVAAIDQAGIVTQSGVRRFIQVLKPVQVAIGDSFGELRPYAGGFRAEVEIDFANPRDRPPELYLRSQPGKFPPRNLPRPHLRLHERRGAAVERGLCARRLLRELGGVRRHPPAQHRRPALPPTNASATRCSTWSATSRWPACRLLGAYRSVRGGHKLNHAVLTALMADRSAWRVVEGGDGAPFPHLRRGRQRNRRRHDCPGLWPGRVLSCVFWTEFP